MASTHIDSKEAKSLVNFELLARQAVEGFIIGLHKSPFHGFSVEFAEHRLYNPGESTRNIDWKVYGRTDKMFTKRYEEETNLRCQILLDISSSMYFPVEAEPMKKKLGFAALAAASLMNLLMKQRDAFGLSVFGSEVYEHTRAKSSTIHYRYLLGILEKYLEIGLKKEDYLFKTKTALPEQLHQIAESIKRRSLVCLFTDMFEDRDNIDEIFAALQHLRYNKHEVVIFHVAHQPKEINFEFDNRPTIFIDMETGEKVRVQPNQVKESFKSNMAKRTEPIKARCLQYRIDFVELDSSLQQDELKTVLKTYLVKRTKMNI